MCGRKMAASLMSAGLQLVTEPSSGGSRLFAVPVAVQTTGVTSPAAQAPATPALEVNNDGRIVAPPELRSETA